MKYEIVFDNYTTKRDYLKKAMLLLALIFDVATIFAFVYMCIESVLYIFAIIAVQAIVWIMRISALKLIFVYRYSIDENRFCIKKEYANKKVAIFDIKTINILSMYALEDVASTITTKPNILYTKNMTCDFMPYVIELHDSKKFFIACDNYMLALLNSHIKGFYDIS